MSGNSPFYKLRDARGKEFKGPHGCVSLVISLTLFGRLNGVDFFTNKLM